MNNKLILAIGSLLIGIVLLVTGVMADIAYKNAGGTIENPTAEPTAAPVPDAPILTAEEFANPANLYRGLCMAHDFQGLPGGTSDKRAKKLAEKGFGGVVTNDGWDSKYLQSENKLKRLNDFVQAVHENGLRVWLYDEKGYPSGAAGGQVVEEDGKYQAVALEQIAVKGSGTGLKTADVPEDIILLEAYKAYLSTDQKTYIMKDVSIVNGKLRFDGLDGDWSGFVYVVANHGCYGNEKYSKTYPNIMNKEAMQKFIDLTYETYGKAIENFSGIVEAFFTDEPGLLATRNLFNATKTRPTIPFDYGMVEDFEQQYGVELESRLPLLFNGLTDEAKLLRAQFYEYIGTRVSESYFGQINAWCEAHGSKGSGHLALEEQLKYHIPFYGDYFRSSVAMGYPGFDILSPRPANYLANMSTGAKYASGPAWLYNKERVFVEICPVSDPDEFETNHLDYALGTMTFTYFDGGNQVASYYGQANSDEATGRTFNEYIGRLGSMTVGAVNKTQIGIYYPIDTVGAYYLPPDDQSIYSAFSGATINDSLVNRMVQDLRKNGLDYVFIDDASIQNGTVTKTSLDFNNFSFTTIIVPRAEVMDLATMQKLCRLADNGANVIFVNMMPRIAMKEADQEKLTELSQNHRDFLCGKVEDVVGKVTTKIAMTLESKQTVYISPWEKNGQEFYFLANADKNTAQVKINYAGVSSFRLYDPIAGTITETSDPNVTVDPYRALFVQPIR